MIESIQDIATRDGAMETFICHPDRGAHPPVLFLMDAPGIRAELYDIDVGTAVIRDLERKVELRSVYREPIPPHVFMRA